MSAPNECRVFHSGGYVVFPDGGPDYEFPIDKMVREFVPLLEHLELKPWWTAAHEAELRELLKKNGGMDED